MNLLAKCAVCVANETHGGWYVLSGVILAGSIGLALFFVWQDRQQRSGR